MSVQVKIINTRIRNHGAMGPGIVPGSGKKVLRFCEPCGHFHVARRVLSIEIRPRKCKAK
jgi:hypothetical protein